MVVFVKLDKYYNYTVMSCVPVRQRSDKRTESVSFEGPSNTKFR